MQFRYDREYQILEQLDNRGVVVMSMMIPQSDLMSVAEMLLDEANSTDSIKGIEYDYISLDDL